MEYYNCTVIGHFWSEARKLMSGGQIPKIIRYGMVSWIREKVYSKV